MMKVALVLAAMFGIVASSTASAQSLRDADVAFTSGNWKVLRAIDPMDDSVRCTGIYQNDYAVQLSKDTLYLGVQGGVQGVTLRFDENPPNRLRLATKMEKDVRSVIVTGNDFSRLATSNRLRYQVSTLVRGISTGDLELSGFNAALDNIRRSCPTESGGGVQSPTPESSSTCTPDMVVKMQEQGLTEQQVKSICGS